LWVVQPVLMVLIFLEIHMRDVKKETNDRISNSLGISFDGEPVVETPLARVIDVPKELMTVDNKSDKDFSDVRNNLIDLIDTGKVAIEGILNVAENGDQPRAYEVVSQMLKTVSELNNDLLGIHQKAKDVQKDNNKYTQNTTNNSIFVGSSSELLDMLNEGRSRTKPVQNDTEYIDE
jgi:hypothetical protein